MTPDDRAFLTSLFSAAVAAADPVRALANHLPARPKGRVVVIGAGKGAAQLAAAFEELWDGPLEGLVVTRYGYACPMRRIKVIESAHPVPDAAGLAASAAVSKPSGAWAQMTLSSRWSAVVARRCCPVRLAI